VSSKKKHKPDNQEQSRRFMEKAREIGADEDKSEADVLIARLAKTPPEPRKRQKGKNHA